MNCCIDCFNDFIVREFIAENGLESDCDYCSQTSIKTVDVTDLAEIFAPLIDTYDYEENFLPSEELGSTSGRLLGELLQDDWQIFSDANDIWHNNKLLKDMFNSNHPSDPERYPP